MIEPALVTGIQKVKNVGCYSIGPGIITKVCDELSVKRNINKSPVLFFIDEFFQNNEYILKKLNVLRTDQVFYVNTAKEPTTSAIDNLTEKICEKGKREFSAVVGVGGGSTLDTTKAISNLLTNGGKASDYQGWDLVRKPGIFKIAIPTLAGTGAEATRTCVMTNEETGLKLGMNSDHSVFDVVFMDPDLLDTVPRNQYFFSGMDAYIHSFESINGSYRNVVGDALSKQTLTLCREVFFADNMMASLEKEKLMTASFLGGCAIASSYVGLVHPLSAGLSVVLGIKHCLANCIVMQAMEEFYPYEYKEFWSMVEKQEINIPKGICDDCDEHDFDRLYNASIIHEKPFVAFGSQYKQILKRGKVIDLFQKM